MTRVMILDLYDTMLGAKTINIGKHNFGALAEFAAYYTNSAKKDSRIRTETIDGLLAGDGDFIFY